MNLAQDSDNSRETRHIMWSTVETGWSQYSTVQKPPLDGLFNKAVVEDCRHDPLFLLRKWFKLILIIHKIVRYEHRPDTGQSELSTLRLFKIPAFDNMELRFSKRLCTFWKSLAKATEYRSGFSGFSDLAHATGGSDGVFTVLLFTMESYEGFPRCPAHSALSFSVHCNKSSVLEPEYPWSRFCGLLVCNEVLLFKRQAI